MKLPMGKGFSYGLTSGVITTLGLMVGMYSGTHSKPVVLGAIITIAIADALSDSFGIHISEEAENRHTPKEVWRSTYGTFLSKFFFAGTFVLPVLLFDLSTAVLISIAWGLILIATFSYFLAQEQKNRPVRVIAEHIAITLVVVTCTHLIGGWVSTIFE